MALVIDHLKVELEESMMIGIDVRTRSDDVRRSVIMIPNGSATVIVAGTVIGFITLETETGSVIKTGGVGEVIEEIVMTMKGIATAIRGGTGVRIEMGERRATKGSEA